MREAYLNKEWLTTPKGEFIGVRLGSDFCTEHETGIEIVKSSFGILGRKDSDSEVIGIERRRTRRVPPEFMEFEKDGFTGIGFYFSRQPSWIKHLFDEGASNLKLKNNNVFSSYWASDGFLLVARPDDAGKIKELTDAIKRLDLAIFLGGKLAFSNGGLILSIVSRMPGEIIDAMKKGDESNRRLKEETEKTGIRKKLNAAGKEFFALSPRWQNETEKQIIYWLNPYEQKMYNAGWYTIEDLLLWIKDDGPIMNKEKTS